METIQIEKKSFETLLMMVEEMHKQNRGKDQFREIIELLEAAIALNVSESTISQLLNRNIDDMAEFTSKLANNSLLKRMAQCDDMIEAERSIVKNSPYRWTGSKSEIVELIEAILLAGSINDGNVVKKEFYEFMGNILSVDLSNHNNIFDHICNRKEIGGDRYGRIRYLSNLMNVFAIKLQSRDCE